MVIKQIWKRRILLLKSIWFKAAFTDSVKSLSDACTKHIFYLFSNHFLSSSPDPLFLTAGPTHLTDTVFVKIVIVTQNSDFVWHSSTYTWPVVYLQRECAHVTEDYDIFPQNFISWHNDRPSDPWCFWLWNPSKGCCWTSWGPSQSVNAVNTELKNIP